MKKKVLLIENDVYYTSMMKAVLSSANYEIDVATDVEGAKRLAKNNPSLVILSLDMPGGFKLLESFRHSEIVRAPMLIISSIPVKEKPLNLLLKPFTDEELLERVQNIIGFTVTEEELLKIQEELITLTKEKADVERRLRNAEESLSIEREKRKRLLSQLKKIIEEFEE